MATQILALPLLSFSMSIGTHEDWTDSLGAYLDGDGDPISLAGLTLDFQMRRTAPDANAAVTASSGATVHGLPVNGLVVASGNVPGLSVPRTTMGKVAPGVYVAELQATGDGITRTIGLYAVTVVQGIVR